MDWLAENWIALLALGASAVALFFTYKSDRRNKADAAIRAENVEVPWTLWVPRNGSRVIGIRKRGAFAANDVWIEVSNHGDSVQHKLADTISDGTVIHFIPPPSMFENGVTMSHVNVRVRYLTPAGKPLVSPAQKLQILKSEIPGPSVHLMPDED